MGERDVVISGSEDRTVRIWNPSSANPIAVQDTFHPVTAVAAAAGLVVAAAGPAICTFGLT